MQYSPKLKKAAEQIKSILKEHDIGASIVLHTPGHSEYLMEISPSYSCAFIDPVQHAVRVRTRLQEDYNGDAAARNKAQEDTVNMFHCLLECTGMHAIQFMEIDKMLATKFKPEHTGGGHSSHNTQNN